MKRYYLRSNLETQNKDIWVHEKDKPWRLILAKGLLNDDWYPVSLSYHRSIPDVWRAQMTEISEAEVFALAL